MDMADARPKVGLCARPPVKAPDRASERRRCVCARIAGVSRVVWAGLGIEVCFRPRIDVGIFDLAIHFLGGIPPNISRLYPLGTLMMRGLYRGAFNVHVC